MCFFRKRRAQKKAIEAEKARLAQEEAIESKVQQPVEKKIEVKKEEAPVEVKPAAPVVKQEPPKVESKPAAPVVKQEPPKVESKPAAPVVQPVAPVEKQPTETPKATAVTPETKESKTPKVVKYHVSQNKDEDSDSFKKWRVRKEGSTKTIKFFDTQKEAIEFAEGLAESAGSSVVIHKVDGSIRKQDYTKKA